MVFDGFFEQFLLFWTKYHQVFLFVCFVAGDQTQGPRHDQHTLYYKVKPLALLRIFYFNFVH